jgi:uncharacterized protein YbcV (DUF1398 family)
MSPCYNMRAEEKRTYFQFADNILIMENIHEGQPNHFKIY